MGKANPERLAAAIADGILNMGLDVDPDIAPKLADYLVLIERWNRVDNLTAVRDPGDMVSRHILDSLSALQYLQPGRVADIGTGAGLPGIPLAVARPDWQFELVDASAKRVRFVQQACIELGLKNVSVEQARVQDYHPDQPFDNVISRAFASLPDFVQQAGHLVADQGQLVAMKGPEPESEMSELPDDWKIAGLASIQVPAGAAARTIITLRPNQGA